MSFIKHMPATAVDSYHLTQFVLESVHEGVQDWEAFMKRLQKMYKKHVPDNVLYGLMRKNIPELSALCVEQFEKNRMEAQRLLLLQAECVSKVRSWEERREKGNHTAWVQYCDKKKEAEARAYKRQKEDQQKMVEDYVEKMKPVWEQEMQKIIDKRCLHL